MQSLPRHLLVHQRMLAGHDILAVWCPHPAHLVKRNPEDLHHRSLVAPRLDGAVDGRNLEILRTLPQDLPAVPREHRRLAGATTLSGAGVLNLARQPLALHRADQRNPHVGLKPIQVVVHRSRFRTRVRKYREISRSHLAVLHHHGYGGRLDASAE